MAKPVDPIIPSKNCSCIFLQSALVLVSSRVAHVERRQHRVFEGALRANQVWC
jgi:hypothetical protein